MTVYVVGHSPRTGPVKIGYTDNLADRLRCLQRGETCPLVVHQRFSRSRPSSDLDVLHAFDEGDRGLERHLHFVFREFRIDGEWFSLGASPDEVIDKVAAAAHSFFRIPAGSVPGNRQPQLPAPAPLPPLVVEPLTHLAESAARHHEMFQAWVAAGFSDDQAMKLLIAAMDRESPPA